MGHGPRRALTLVELVVVFAIVFVALSLLATSFRRDRGPHRVTYCGMNLGGIGRAALTYAEAHRGAFPVADHDPMQTDGPEWVRSATFVGVNRNLPDRVTDPAKPDENLQNNGSNTRGWYKLLLGGSKSYVRPKQLICPSARTPLQHIPDGATLFPADDEAQQKPFFDFDGTKRAVNDSELIEFSYSFQVTLATNFGTAEQSQKKGFKLTNVMDPGLAIAADRNPYSNHIATVGGNTMVQWMPGKKGIVNPPSGAEFASKWNTPAANSRNHNGDGQNVAYLDGHAKWWNHPGAGVDDDFIWGTGDPTTYKPSEPARGLGYGLMRPGCATDSVLVP